MKTNALNLLLRGVTKKHIIALLMAMSLAAGLSVYAGEKQDTSVFQTDAGVIEKPQGIVLQQDEELASAVFKFTSTPKLKSAIALIYDERSNRPLYTKHAEDVTPIASITKLMTAMVVLDAKLPMDEKITITKADVDHLKGTRSRVHSGSVMTRRELLKIALMASENRAASALARTYPGGSPVAIVMMNIKAKQLGMTSTRFFDPTGLNSHNVSTAQDLVLMVRAAQNYETIHKFTTTTSHTVQLARHRSLRFRNTNPLVRSNSWDIGISKTGYISEAGRCLVMQATISNRPVIIVLLDSWGKRTRVGDANRVKRWMESSSRRAMRLASVRS